MSLPGARLYLQYNILEQVPFTGGVTGMFSGDERKIQDCIDRLNAAG